MDELEIKRLTKELEELRSILPTYKDKRSCGRIIHNDPVELLLKIEELEEKIERIEEENSGKEGGV